MLGAYRAPRRPWYGPRSLCKCGKRWEESGLGTAIPFPPDQALSVTTAPSLVILLPPPGRRGQVSGESQGPPRMAARPSQASPASEAAALPMGEGVFPEPSAGAAPPQVPGETTDHTTEAGFSQPEKAQFGGLARETGCPPHKVS